jgi:uncharacterized protein (TIGR01777 family)
MRILVSGSRGLIGSELVPAVESAGHTVVRLVRGSTKAGEIAWLPTGHIAAAALQGVDAIIHLAGETIQGRWTPEKKRAIRESRVEGTRNLVSALSKMGRPPQVFISASAIGYYGDRGTEPLTEETPGGIDFLAQVARDWEAAAETASQAGMRAVELRFGVVLSAKGGALGKMLLPFRLGAGGRVGSGRQVWSWVAIDDVIGGVLHVLNTAALRGPVNVVAPHPVSNAEFTRTLAAVLHRPAIFPMPETAVKALFGEMGTTLLLSSQRVIPAKLEATGYRFKFPDLKPALEHLLRR